MAGQRSGWISIMFGEQTRDNLDTINQELRLLLGNAYVEPTSKDWYHMTGVYLGYYDFTQTQMDDLRTHMSQMITKMNDAKFEFIFKELKVYTPSNKQPLIVAEYEINQTVKFRKYLSDLRRQAVRIIGSDPSSHTVFSPHITLGKLSTQPMYDVNMQIRQINQTIGDRLNFIPNGLELLPTDKFSKIE